jgi:dCMP deaminase
MSNKWDQRFLRLALETAGWSKDPSTQVGAVIVGPDREIRSTGYNGLPRGVDDNNPEREARPGKYFFYEHAERNAIFNAARVGIPLKDCTIYVTSKPLKFGCCADCVRAIIQAGITRVVQEPELGDASRWGDQVKAGLAMLAEAGVQNDKVSID